MSRDAFYGAYDDQEESTPPRIPNADETWRPTMPVIQAHNKVEVGAQRIGKFKRLSCGLEAPAKFSKDDWKEAADILFRIDDAIQWYLGDMLRYAADIGYGDAKAIAAHYDREPQTIYNYKYVAEKVEISLRRETLSFGHHFVVANMEPDEQAYWLDLAEQGSYDHTDKGGNHVFKKWSVKKLRDEIRGAKPTTLPSGATAQLRKFSLSFRREYQKINLDGVGGDEAVTLKSLITSMISDLESLVDQLTE